jgi:predicted RecB family nuclease
MPDIKRPPPATVEPRLQVAFYHAMLAGLLAQHGVPVAGIETAILYRGVLPLPADLAPAEAAQLEEQQAAARALFGVETGFLERVPDPDAYLEAVRDLVTGPESTARQIITQPFAAVPYHLTRKCDGCLYNEFCMQWSARHDDLSLLPHLTALEKEALQRAGVATVQALAHLKDFAPPDDPEKNRGETLVPAPGEEAHVGRLATTWPVGPRLDELIHRARRYRRWKRRISPARLAALL